MIINIMILDNDQKLFRNEKAGNNKRSLIASEI